jgi:hypothetical protein
MEMRSPLCFLIVLHILHIIALDFVACRVVVTVPNKGGGYGVVLTTHRAVQCARVFDT